MGARQSAWVEEEEEEKVREMLGRYGTEDPLLEAEREWQPDMHERMADINVEEASAEELWQRMTEEERSRFRDAVREAEADG